MHVYPIGYFDTPIGTLCAMEEDGCLVRLSLVPEEDRTQTPPRSSPLAKTVGEALKNYFSGSLSAFDRIPVRLCGTDFEKRVWEALRHIPFGQTRTYGDIACEIGSPKAFRAVGGACHRNELLLVVPCHRVVGAKGHLTGFACGLDKKEILINHEQNYKSKGEKQK